MNTTLIAEEQQRLSVENEPYIAFQQLYTTWLLDLEEMETTVGSNGFCTSLRCVL